MSLSLSLSRFTEINGRRYLVALHRAHPVPPRDDCLPAGERNAAKRYREPSLFTRLEGGVTTHHPLVA